MEKIREASIAPPCVIYRLNRTLNLDLLVIQKLAALRAEADAAIARAEAAEAKNKKLEQALLEREQEIKSKDHRLEDLEGRLEGTSGKLKDTTERCAVSFSRLPFHRIMI
jgi:chromosome segregation ATPase